MTPCHLKALTKAGPAPTSTGPGPREATSAPLFPAPKPRTRTHRTAGLPAAAPLSSGKRGWPQRPPPPAPATAAEAAWPPPPPPHDRLLLLPLQQGPSCASAACPRNCSSLPRPARSFFPFLPPPLPAAAVRAAPRERRKAESLVGVHRSPARDECC